MASAEDESSGFKVTDRRSFTEAGEPRAEAPTSPDQSATASTTAPPLGPVDFATFVLSLGSSALMHLGDIERPDGAKEEVDLSMAKHTIDIISMLQARTKGNLNPQEERLVEGLLYDLRLRYVEAAKAHR
jgi:hypothetical protein